MTPLNEPMPGSDPLGNDPSARKPLELIFDFVMITGAAILLWNFLVVTGLLPGQTILMSKDWTSITPDQRDYMFIGALTLVGLADIPAYYVLLNSRRKRPAPASGEAAAVWMKIMAFFALMPWVYLLTLYLVKPQGN